MYVAEEKFRSKDSQMLVVKVKKMCKGVKRLWAGLQAGLRVGLRVVLMTR
jgi:hypothetical protein